MSKLIKNSSEIERIRRSGRILADALRRLKSEVKPGLATIELDNLARKIIKEEGARPAFLGYQPEGAEHPFPYALCVSINETIVHGRPSDTKLNEGDIVSLDLGVDWKGGITDAAITVPVGNISSKARELMSVTKKALDSAIRKAIAGNTLGDIGNAIESVIEASGAYVMDGLGGHGVGTEVHEEPFVYNFGEPGEGMKLLEGMVIAIEPMASFGTNEIIQLSDDSFATRDGSISAHFEHTVLIREKRVEIITL